MLDSGFQIQEDLLLYFCRLVVPPAARVKNQMTKPDPNLRIHVERAINRMKFFQDFRRSYTSDKYVDDIILTSVALCSLKPKFIKTNKKDLQK